MILPIKKLRISSGHWVIIHVSISPTNDSTKVICIDSLDGDSSERFLFINQYLEKRLQGVACTLQPTRHAYIQAVGSADCGAITVEIVRKILCGQPLPNAQRLNLSEGLAMKKRHQDELRKALNLESNNFAFDQ